MTTIVTAWTRFGMALAATSSMLFTLPTRAQSVPAAPAISAELGQPASGARSSLRFSATGPMSSPRIGQVLGDFETDPPVTTRGSADASNAEGVFSSRCRSVALILVETADGVGTGTGSVLAQEGIVLTAAHVIKGAKDVMVGLFPDCRPGTKPVGFKAKVVKQDDYVDLAALQIAQPPAGMSVMPLGNLGDVRPGSTVLMIGHPRELLMSLSRGLVSAVRPQFQWQAGDGIPSKATVIQTDGAINPGNSGGPMLSTSGSLVGVNSFISGPQSAGLNFAVSVAEVREFFARPGSRVAPTQRTADKKPAEAAKECEPKVLREGREGAAKFEMLDLTCSGKANAKLVQPDDAAKPAELWVDRNGDGKADVVYYITDRAAGDPAYSLWDDDFSGRFQWRGEHIKGDWEPISKTRVAASR